MVIVTFGFITCSTSFLHCCSFRCYLCHCLASWGLHLRACHTHVENCGVTNPYFFQTNPLDTLVSNHIVIVPTHGLKSDIQLYIYICLVGPLLHLYNLFVLDIPLFSDALIDIVRPVIFTELCC